MGENALKFTREWEEYWIPDYGALDQCRINFVIIALVPTLIVHAGPEITVIKCLFQINKNANSTVYSIHLFKSEWDWSLSCFF